MTDPFRRFDDYDFRHFVGMRAEVGAADDVHRLFALQDGDGHNAWFAARDRRGELDGYLDDLHMATELAHAAPPGPEAIGLQARYALLAAILRDAARNLDPGLSAALVRTGLWTRRHALAWADLDPDREAALTTVLDALQEPGAGQDDLGLRALTTGAAIGSSDNKTLAVAALARQLPEHQRARALDIIAHEENEGSRLGGLERIAAALPPAFRERAVAVAGDFRQPDLRARALAAVAATLDEPERSETYAAALGAAQEALRPRELGNPGAQTLERLAGTLPEKLLPEIVELANAAAMSSSEREGIVAAVLERRVHERPDWVLEKALELDGISRDTVLTKVAVELARAGRAEDAVAAWADISFEPTAAGAVDELAPKLPSEQLAELAERVTAFNAYHRVEALREIACAPAAPGAELRRIVERLPDEDERRAALQAVIPALAPNDVDDVLGPAPGLDGMQHTAPHLTLAQALRVLDAARGERVHGLDCDGFGALLVRVAELGDPAEALARLAELEDVWELDRGKMLARLAAHLPAGLLPRARGLVQPNAEPVARLLARARLLAELPVARWEEALSEAVGLPNTLDRVRVLTAIVGGLPAERRADAAAALLCAVEASLDHPSLDRRKVHDEAWRRLAEAPPGRAFASAEALDDLDDRFTALLRLSDAFDEAAAGVVELVVAHPNAGALVVDAGPSPAVCRRLAAAIRAIGDDASLARAVEALAAVVPRAEVPGLVARLTAIEDAHVRLPGLDALVPRMPAVVRRRVARNELSRRDEWLFSRWLVVLGTRVIARCELAAAEALVPKARETVREFPQREDRASAAVLLAEALDDVIDAELLEDVLPLDIDVMPALIRWLDRDGVRRVRAALSESAPSYRHHEIVAALARRALAFHDDRLAIECLTEPDVYRIEDAVAAIADALPQRLIETAAEIARTDHDALGALARRASRLGDGDAALALVDRAADHHRADMLAELAPIVPAAAVPALLERARGAGYGAGRALVAVLPRVTRAERREVLVAAVAACDDFRTAMADTRVRLLHHLIPELVRLPAAQLASLFGDMLRQSAVREREEVLCDLRGFAPALLRRFGPEVASALDDAIRVAGGDRWP